MGFTGKLILDCYIGTCTEEIFHRQTRTVCDVDDDCEDVDESWTEYKKIIDYDCSEQCMKEGGEGCYCSNPYNKRGTCERKKDDIYKEKGKDKEMPKDEKKQKDKNEQKSPDKNDENK